MAGLNMSKSFLPLQNCNRAIFGLGLPCVLLSAAAAARNRRGDREFPRWNFFHDAGCILGNSIADSRATVSLWLTWK